MAYKDLQHSKQLFPDHKKNKVDCFDYFEFDIFRLCRSYMDYHHNRHHTNSQTSLCFQLFHLYYYLPGNSFLFHWKYQFCTYQLQQVHNYHPLTLNQYHINSQTSLCFQSLLLAVLNFLHGNHCIYYHLQMLLSYFSRFWLDNRCKHHRQLLHHHHHYHYQQIY